MHVVGGLQLALASVVAKKERLRAIAIARRGWGYRERGTEAEVQSLPRVLLISSWRPKAMVPDPAGNPMIFTGRPHPTAVHGAGMFTTNSTLKRADFVKRQRSFRKKPDNSES